MSMNFPRFLLDETPWDFAGQPAFPSRAEFEAAVLRHLRVVQEYAPELRPEEHWRPHEVALRCPRVVVRYECDAPGREASWREVELRSEEGASFTAGGLFYTLHNAIIEDVRDNGHRYFEGLELEGTDGGVPVYLLVTGS